MNPLTERLGGFFVFARGWSSLEVFDSGQAASSQKKITARLLDQPIDAASRQHGKDKFQLPGCFDWSSRLPGSTEKINSRLPGCSNAA